MSLTTGRGPLSKNPAGRFSVPIPADVAYVEPFRRRVRGLRNRETIIDSERVVLVHRQGQPPMYAFPEGDVRAVAMEPVSEVDGYVRVPWDAVDEWWEEDERVTGHPRNPYHRIDCVRSSRRLRVDVAGVTIVDTTETLLLYETALEPKLYIDRRLVSGVRLVPSGTTTYCPYKGTTTYWNAIVSDVVVVDVAWSYDDPLPESLPIKELLSFEPGSVTLQHDLPDAAL
jgi:uncharacterized protein (DUF427 family)